MHTTLEPKLEACSQASATLWAIPPYRIAMVQMHHEHLVPLHIYVLQPLHCAFDQGVRHLSHISAWQLCSTVETPI